MRYVCSRKPKEIGIIIESFKNKIVERKRTVCCLSAGHMVTTSISLAYFFFYCRIAFKLLSIKCKQSVSCMSQCSCYNTDECCCCGVCFFRLLLFFLHSLTQYKNTPKNAGQTQDIHYEQLMLHFY